MSTSPKKSNPFEVKTVESLVALMTEHDLNEIYLRDGSQHIRLRRGGMVTAVASGPAASAPIAPAAAPPTAASPAPADPAAAPPAKKNLVEIKSETVGTFYTQAKPGEPPFVKLGDRVTPSKVVGLVEVMKTYNEIQANCTGVIVEVLVENGKYVDFGQVLFRVDPS